MNIVQRANTALILGLLGGLVALLATGGAAQAGDDTVMQKGGQGIPGVTVLSEGCEQVAIDKDGDGTADEQVPAGAVDAIKYGDTPASFLQGQVFMKQSRYSEAVESFQKALQEKDVRAFWMQQYANFLIGECLQRQAVGDKAVLAKARAAYGEVIAKVPDGRMVPPAMRGIGLCFLAEANPAAAQTEFEKIVANEKFGAGWVLRGKVLVGRAQARQGKVKEALALCDEVAKDPLAETDVEVGHELAIGRAEVLVAAKRYAEARAIYQKLADAADARDAEAKAQAYNDIGDAYLAEGKAREALFAYLRVHVLYFKADDEWARALYGAAECFTLLKDPNRARDMLGVLEKEHAGSPWTAKAKQKVGG